MSWQPKKWVLACRDGFRFEVCFGFTIRDITPFLLVPPSCVSKLGNTSKCYPHTSAVTSPDCQALLLPPSALWPSALLLCKFRTSPPLVGCHQSTCHGPIRSRLLSAMRKARLSPVVKTPLSAVSVISLCDTLSQVRWKRGSNLEPEATQAAIRPTFLTNSHALGTAVPMPLVPEEASTYPRKEDPIGSGSCTEHRVTHVLPRKELVLEGYIFFCYVDVFLIYRIF